MSEDYLNFPQDTTFTHSFLFMMKLRIFGKKIEARCNGYTIVWYVYKGKLYLTRYDAF